MNTILYKFIITSTFYTLLILVYGAQSSSAVASSEISKAGWSEQEEFVWERLVNGDVANLSQFPCKEQKDQLDNCIISVKFLESILLEDAYRSQLTRHGVRIIGARFVEPLDLRNASIINQVLLKNCIFEKPVNFAWLTTDKFLSFEGSKFSKNSTLDLSRIRAAQSLDLSKVSVKNLELLAANIDELLDLRGAKVSGSLNMRRINVGTSLLMRTKSEKKDEKNDENNGEYKAVTLHHAKIGGDLDLSDSTFTTFVNLTSTVIEGELRLGSSFHPQAKWAKGAKLILKNAQADSIEDGVGDLNYWPEVDMVGFTYQRLGGLAGRIQDLMLERDADWFIKWQLKQPHYSPQPYQQLINVMRNSGYESKAKLIGYASKQREHMEAWEESELLRWVNLSLQLIFIGYGYVYLWTFIWIIVLTCVGAYLLKKQKNSVQPPLLDRLFYSLDMLIPVIEIDSRHTKEHLEGGVKYYFYLHTLLGFILASYLIAGLSGITK